MTGKRRQEECCRMQYQHWPPCVDGWLRSDDDSQYCYKYALYANQAVMRNQLLLSERDDEGGEIKRKRQYPEKRHRSDICSDVSSDAE